MNTKFVKQTSSDRWFVFVNDENIGETKPADMNLDPKGTITVQGWYAIENPGGYYHFCENLDQVVAHLLSFKLKLTSDNLAEVAGKVLTDARLNGMVGDLLPRFGKVTTCRIMQIVTRWNLADVHKFCSAHPNYAGASL